MAFGSGASVEVWVTFVPGAPSATLQDDGDDSATSVVRLVSGVPAVVAFPSSDWLPRNTSKPFRAAGWILDGQVSVVIPVARSWVTVRLMSVPSPANTWTARLFEPVAVALLVHVVSMLQRTWTR